MVQGLSLLCAIGFFFNALLHLSLIFGSSLGEYVLGGKNKILPYPIRIISGLFLILWLFIGICYLNYGGWLLYLPLKGIDRIVIYLAAIFLFFAIFSNLFLTTSSKERKVMTPFCFITFILTCILLIF